MPIQSARPRPPAWPVVVAGGGPPGLALALALRRELGEAVAVTICDPALGNGRPDGRAFALSADAAAFLDRLAVWPGIRDRAQPIRTMTITDSRVADAIRPAYLQFGDGDEPLGFMMEAKALVPALREACRAVGVGFEAQAVRAHAAAAGRATVGDTDRPAALLVGADGARSRLREAAGIAWFGRRYRQSGIVATVSHGRGHEGRATQHFLPAGPFAILPLVDREGRHRSSIVWTEREDRVAALLGLDRAAATAEVETRFGPELGAIRLDTPLSAHPLGFGLARSFAAERFALLGDAAHEIHPLAGQGLNLGLADAAALAARMGEAVRLGLDPGGPEVLAAYERDRRFDAVALAGLTDGLNRLFSNDVLPARVLRDLGLGLVDRAPGLKRALAGAAGGSRAPRRDDV